MSNLQESRSGFADAAELRCRLNPVVMHAQYVLDACRDNLLAARALAAHHIRECPDGEVRHWIGVHRVLCGRNEA